MKKKYVVYNTWKTLQDEYKYEAISFIEAEENVPVHAIIAGLGSPPDEYVLRTIKEVPNPIDLGVTGLLDVLWERTLDARE